MGFPGGLGVENPPANEEDTGSIPLGQEEPLRRMPTHPSTPAWEVPMDRGPSGLQPLGSLESQPLTGNSKLLFCAAEPIPCEEGYLAFPPHNTSLSPCRSALQR